MTRIVPEKVTREPIGNDPWTVGSQSEYVSPHLPHGLSLLNSISMLSVQEEASLAQGILEYFLSLNAIDLF
jgi:hypothetical protein